MISFCSVRIYSHNSAGRSAVREPSSAQYLPSTAQHLPSNAQYLSSTTQHLPSNAQYLSSIKMKLYSAGQQYIAGQLENIPHEVFSHVRLPSQQQLLPPVVFPAAVRRQRVDARGYYYSLRYSGAHLRDITTL